METIGNEITENKLSEYDLSAKKALEMNMAGMTYKEIAEELGINCDALTSRIRRYKVKMGLIPSSQEKEKKSPSIVKVSSGSLFQMGRSVRIDYYGARMDVDVSNLAAVLKAVRNAM